MLIHPDDRSLQEDYEHECLLRDYGVTPAPEPAPDPSEQEMREMEDRAIDAEVQRRREMWGPMVYVSRDVVRLEHELNRYDRRRA